MPSKITIISQGAAFMTNALVKNLQQAGFAASVIEPKIDTLNQCRKESDVYLIYAGDFISEITDFFVYLKDICSEDEKMICIIGYPPEIDDIKHIVSDNLVAHAFERPFDMKDLISDMEKLCAADDERKKGKHILLIDDDLTYLKTVQGWLSGRYRVTIARSGMQAITYIATHVPDLILLDGGKGHVAAVREVFDEMKINVPLFGLVKDDKHRTRAIAADGGEIQINSNKNLFKMLTEIQDEVHRFSINYQRKKHKMSQYELDLTKVKGIGEKKALTLLKQYKTKQGIKAASVEELMETAKISRETAEELHFFVQNTF